MKTLAIILAGVLLVPLLGCAHAPEQVSTVSEEQAIDSAAVESAQAETEPPSGNPFLMAMGEFFAGVFFYGLMELPTILLFVF
jgi:hypothetical protein